jgi:hypothetical protein
MLRVIVARGQREVVRVEIHQTRHHVAHLILEVRPCPGLGRAASQAAHRADPEAVLPGHVTVEGFHSLRLGRKAR